MKKLFTIIALFAFSAGTFGQTEVSGNQSGTWSSGNSPYNVVGEIIVPSGQILNIEAGVEVNFQGQYKFTVNGNLQAIGTESDSIFFTTNNQATGWGGIRFDSSDGISTLSYCRIEYGKTSGDYPDNHGGGMAFFGADAVVSNCVFADNSSEEAEGMGGAVYGYNTGSTSGPLTLFTDCLFIRNHAYSEGGAIKFTGDMNTEIRGCEFLENYCNYGGGAISLYGVYGTKMIQCLFAQNYTMYASGGAIHSLGFGNSFEFENCTITENEAVTGDGGGIYLVNAAAELTNCIVFDNPGMYSDNIFVDFSSTAEINYCNLTMPDGGTGSNNINENPEFEDAVNLDYHLSENSPCIDAGTDIGYEYVGEAPDIGCFEYGWITGLGVSSAYGFSIYPNPTTDKINIDFADNEIQQIKISDLTGKTILEKNTFKKNQAIDLSDFKSGTYIFSMQTAEGIITRKIMKK